jgi:hypothetical protein
VLLAGDDWGVNKADKITSRNTGLTIYANAVGVTGAVDVNIYYELNTGEVYGSPILLGTAAVNGTNYSLTTSATQALVDGTYRIRARAVDMAGNESPINAVAQDLVFTIDSTLPVVPTIAFTDPDRVADITYVDGATLITRNTNAITVSGQGEAGSRIVLFNDVNNNGQQDPGEIDLALFAPDGVSELANTARIVAPNGSYRFDLRALKNGDYNLRTLTIDPAGNTRLSTSSVRFAVDTVVLPVLRVELAQNADVPNNDNGRSPYDAITNDSTPTFRVWLPRDTVVGDSIRINRENTLAGAQIGTGVVTAGDVTRGYIDISTLTPLNQLTFSSTTAITAFYIDRAGNASTGVALNRNLVVDTTPPEKPVAQHLPTINAIDDT